TMMLDVRSSMELFGSINKQMRGVVSAPRKENKMRLAASNCTQCRYPVKGRCFADQSLPFLGHLPPDSTPEDILRPPSIAGPQVVFIRCKFGDAWRFKSSCRTDRVCISKRRGLLRLSADWCSMSCLELAPQAGDEILSRWTAERSLYPESRRIRSCGGLKSCVTVDTFPERELYWRRFLGNLLSAPESWWHFDWSALDFR